MFVWAHPPNWSNGFEVTLRYLTDILESRRGKEQRIAKRFRPRTTFEFTSLARRSLFTQVQRELFQELRNEIVMPFWPDRQTLGATVSSGVSSIPVSEVRPWMQTGRILCIVQDGRGEARTITGVVGSVISLDSPLDSPWDASASVLEGFLGYMDSKTTQRAHTSEVNAVTVAFEATPGKEPDGDLGTAGTEFNGLEVFEFPINWGALPRVEILDPRVMLDYDYGIRNTYHPFDFPTVTRRVQLLRNGFDAVREVESFFRRHRGRQREFYVPNVQRDLRPVSGITDGGNTILVDDPGVAAMLTDTTVHKAMAVKLPTGWFYTRIVSAVAGGASTSIQVFDSWPEDAPVTEIGRIAFLNVSNFASDAFNLEWRSDNVATTTVTISTLEDLGSG